MNLSKNSIEQLTQEMENAIDDLFKPTKTIEIDPLTNEIKDEKNLQTSNILSPTISTQKHDTDTISKQESLSIVDMTSLSPETQTALKELQQSLLTIDWEITISHIKQSRMLLDRLNGTLTEKQIQIAQKIMSQMADILATIESTPLPQIPANSPKLLIDLYNFLEQSLISINQITEKTISIPPELSKQITNFFEQIERIQQETPLTIEIETASSSISQTLTSDKELSKEIVSSVGIASEPDITSYKHPTKIKPIEVPQNLLTSPSTSSSLTEVITNHTQKLAKWIDKLNTLEKILAGVSGMEKLLAFYKQLKDDMAAEERILLQSIGKPLGSVEHHQPISSPTPVQPKPKACPWHLLVRTEWWGKRIAFPQEYIAFEGKLPWGRGRQLITKDVFQLKMLKKWPWSKISSLLQGSMANLNEKQLAAMSIPILVSSEPPPSIIITDPHIIILWNHETSKGCAILADTPTLPFKTDTWVWDDTPQKPFFAGILRKNEDEIYVLSQEIFS